MQQRCARGFHLRRTPASQANRHLLSRILACMQGSIILACIAGRRSEHHCVAAQHSAARRSKVQHSSAAGPDLLKPRQRMCLRIYTVMFGASSRSGGTRTRTRVLSWLARDHDDIGAQPGAVLLAAGTTTGQSAGGTGLARQVPMATGVRSRRGAHAAALRCAHLLEGLRVSHCISCLQPCRACGRSGDWCAPEASSRALPSLAAPRPLLPAPQEETLRCRRSIRVRDRRRWIGYTVHLSAGTPECEYAEKG